MRIRTPHASVWVDETPTLSPSASACPSPVEGLPASTLGRPGAGQPAVRWARRAFDGRLGRYVAVRLRNGLLQVALRDADGALMWVDASKALSAAESRRWLQTGFEA